MKHLFLCLAVLTPLLCHAAIKEQKTIDEGGTGSYKAIAITESNLPDYVIYRPKNLHAFHETSFPVVVFANGGCNDTSLPYERMLSEIASHGYIVLALGTMQKSLDDRPLKKSPNQQMPDAIDWIAAQVTNTKSDYFKTADLDAIAFAGQSCGGAQVLATANDPRITTYLMFNSGIGDMQMAGATEESLNFIHAPIIYIVGGESDVAYKNALLDYERLSKVPVVFANAINGGHSGTYEEAYGGAFTKMAVKWLDWRLKGKDANELLFLDHDLQQFPGWTMKSKLFQGSATKMTPHTK